MPKGRILIVEDEQIVAMDIQNSLEQAGYTVAGRADRGEAAIQTAEELRPDLILMDIGLKGEMDGIEAAVQIWARFNIPVIFLTAFSTHSTLGRARLAEPFGYILKPFDERELVSNIEIALYKHGMEKKLRDSEARFRSVFEHSTDGFMLLDSQGHLIKWNTASERISGLPRSEVLGQPIWEVIFRMLPAEQRTPALQESLVNQCQVMVESSYTSGLDHLTEVEIETPQGERRVVQTSGFAIETDEGMLAGAVMRDITASKRAEDALLESQALYHSLVEVSPLSICRKDLAGRFTFANRRFLELSNITLADLVGKTDFDLHPPGLAEKYRRDDQAVLESGDVKEFIEERAILGGESTFVQSIKVPISNGAGKINGVQISFLDITARIRAEQALLESEARLRAITENAPSIIVELDTSGRILYMSRVLPGYQLADVLGKSAADWIAPEYQAVMWQALARAIHTGLPQTYETYAAGANGEMRWYLSNLAPVKAKDQVKSLILVSTDITERKQAESELRKLSQAVEQSANTIVITNIEGQIEYANPKFTETTGYALPEALGQTPRILRSGEHQVEIYQQLWQTIKSGQVWHGEFHNRRKDGSLYWEDTTIAPVKDSDGNLTNFIAVKEDITARKALEAAERDQRQLAEALRDSALALNRSLKLDEVLDRVLENIGRLATYDAAMVLLVEGHSVRKIRYHSMAPEALSQPPLGDTQANLLNVPILQEIRQTRQPCIIADTRTDPRWHTIPGLAWVRSFISAPIEIRAEVAGLINLISAEPDFFTPIHAERLMAFASQAAIAIQNAQLFEQTHQLSVTDPLTELSNRRHFFDIAKIEFERLRRYGGTLTVMMVDIDHFKNLNDTYGHAVGDLALRETAWRIKSSIRAVDIAARYGGEEFVILMPETGLHEACQVAERVRSSVGDVPFVQGAVDFSVTLSLGVAEINPTTKDLDALLIRADQALYAAKAAGRNRVAV